MRDCPACAEPTISPDTAIWSSAPSCPRCSAKVEVAPRLMVPALVIIAVIGALPRRSSTAVLGVLAWLVVIALVQTLLWSYAPLRVVPRTSPRPESTAARWVLLVAMLAIIVAGLAVLVLWASGKITWA